MAEKKGAGGKPQEFDKSSGRYISDYSSMDTSALRERQKIELPSLSFSRPQPEKATGFNRLETKHHQRHAKEMGFKNMREYERAAVEFFNSDKGRLYYSEAKNRFYRYDEKSKLFCSSSHGIIHTFLRYSPKKFEDIKRQDKAYGY